MHNTKHCKFWQLSSFTQDFFKSALATHTSLQISPLNTCNKNTRNLTLHGNAVKRWEQIFLGLGTHKLNFHCWHLVVNKFSVHPPLGENKKHKTNAQNKKLLGMYTTTRPSRANAQNNILFPTYTITLSQANAQWIKSLSKELCDIKRPLCSWWSYGFWVTRKSRDSVTGKKPSALILGPKSDSKSGKVSNFSFWQHNELEPARKIACSGWVL